MLKLARWWGLLACAVLAGTPALAQTTLNVLVQVTLISSSGVCTTTSSTTGVSVLCDDAPVTSAVVPPSVLTPTPVAPTLPVSPVVPPAPPPAPLPSGGSGNVIVGPEPAPPSPPVDPAPGPGPTPVRPGVTPGTTQPTLITVPGTGAPENAAQMYRRLGLMPASLLDGSTLPWFSRRVEITGWRTVQFDNGSYVELTLSW